VRSITSQQGRLRLFDLTVIRFAIVGLINTLFGLLIIYSCKWFVGLGDILSNIIGYSAGLLLSFILNKKWTFNDQSDPVVAILKFSLVIGCAYLINLAVVLTFIHYLLIDSYLAQAMGIAPYAILTYLGSRHWVFNERI